MMGSCLFEAGIANESHLVLLSMIGKKYTDLTSLSVRHPLPSLSIIQAPFFCHLHNQKSSLSKLNHLNLVSRISKEVKDTRTLTTLTAKKSLRTTKTHNCFQVPCHLLEFCTVGILVYWAVLWFEKLHMSTVNQCG